ncbi:Uridine kinase [Polynucleobacter meluiroseus]|uniref:phosphoribulokinase n=1 Tax=Polynucleobacter meluiroseus TaxID=1938814 RepID=A0A240E0Z4_9BURK|nr:hypothetical protein [Polynucleobacter meluiroseus]SNX29115.1 Uridine kinase [Polynucleobacter meluiroseus]
MVNGPNKIIKSPLFIFGLLARVILIYLTYQFTSDRQLIVSFCQLFHGIFNLTWSNFNVMDKNLFIENYGFFIGIIFSPFAIIGLALDSLFALTDKFLILSFSLVLLISDLLGLFILIKFNPKQYLIVLLAYWLSPLSLALTYWFWSPEIVSMVILMAALLMLKKKKIITSGIFLGFAAATKLATGAIFPFLAIYIWQNRSIRATLLKFLIAYAAVVGALLLMGVLIKSIAMFDKLIPEFLPPLMVQNDINESLLLYVLFLYSLWWLRRTNFTVLMTVLAVSVIVIVSFPARDLSWYVWAIPFLVFYATKTTWTGFAIVYAFMVLATVTSVMDILLNSNASLKSFFITLNYALVIILVVRMIVEGIQFNSFFRVNRRPLVFGIAGDSGSGKDTLAVALRNIFGSHSVSMMYGDAYHKWDRSGAMWRAVTHLDPKANNLSQMTSDAVSVVTGKTIYRRHYNHQVGKFTSPSPIKPNNVLIISGLHALYQHHLRSKLDVKIFLNTDDILRQYWKIRRDTSSRNHKLASLQELIKSRNKDSALYIAPQALYADIIFDLVPMNPHYLLSEDFSGEASLKLNVRIKDAMYQDALIRILIGICGLHVDWEISDEGRIFSLTVEGDVSAEDIALGAATLVPDLDALIEIERVFEANAIGIMQLIILAHTEQTLHKRILE